MLKRAGHEHVKKHEYLLTSNSTLFKNFVDRNNTISAKVTADGQQSVCSNIDKAHVGKRQLFRCAEVYLGSEMFNEVKPKSRLCQKTLPVWNAWVYHPAWVIASC